jgi:Spy/CpxP family protein refolding chaperone
MNKPVIITALAALSLASISVSATAQNPSGYAGQQHRAIKALSEQEIADLTNGRGMGLAKVAELNSYPGPMHVLELADRLELTIKQRAATEALMRAMHQKARPLGVQIIDAERDLDRAFAENRIDAAGLKRRVDAIAALQGKLRTAHLETHLSQRALLTPAQIARYDELRGYRSNVAPINEGHRHH